MNVGSLGGGAGSWALALRRWHLRRRAETGGFQLLSLLLAAAADAYGCCAAVRLKEAKKKKKEDRIEGRKMKGKGWEGEEGRGVVDARGGC
jgi:hypothetical protein